MNINNWMKIWSWRWLKIVIMHSLVWMYSYMQFHVNYVVKLERYDCHQGDLSLHVCICVHLDTVMMSLLFYHFWFFPFPCIHETSGSTISEACQHEQLAKFRYPVPHTNNRDTETLIIPLWHCWTLPWLTDLIKNHCYKMCTGSLDNSCILFLNWQKKTLPFTSSLSVPRSHCIMLCIIWA